MKSFFKWSAVVAGIMMALGLIMLFSSTIMGGGRALSAIRDGISEGQLEELDQVIKTLNGMNIWIGDHPIHVGGYDKTMQSLTVNGKTTEYNENGVGSATGSYAAGEINNLYLQLGAGTFTIKEIPTQQGEESQDVIRIYVQGRGVCDYYVDEEGTLYVEGFQHRLNYADSSRNQITLEVPEGMSFQRIELEAGAGLFELTGLYAYELEADIGAGQLILNDMTVKELSLDLGAGQTIAELMEVQNANLCIGMGECVFQGSIKGDLEAECSMGNLELNLTGSSREHNFRIECNAGSIEADGFHMAVLTGERAVDNGADSDYELSCNMGNITLKFEEK